MRHFYFACDGINKDGYNDTLDQDFIHFTEEEARRGVIYNLNELYEFRPRKLTLINVELEDNIWTQLG